MPKGLSVPFGDGPKPTKRKAYIAKGPSRRCISYADPRAQRAASFALYITPEGPEGLSDNKALPFGSLRPQRGRTKADDDASRFVPLCFLSVPKGDGPKPTKRKRKQRVSFLRSPFGHILRRLPLSGTQSRKQYMPKGAQRASRYILRPACFALWARAKRPEGPLAFSPLGIYCGPKGLSDKEVGVSSSPLGSVAPSAFAPTGGQRSASFGHILRRVGGALSLAVKGFRCWRRATNIKPE